MRRSHLIAPAVLVSLILGTARVTAIVYGFVDSTNAFPNTGAFLVKSGDTGQIFQLCSGTLIARTVFLTAGHCTAFFEQMLAASGYTAFISFDNPIPFGDLTSRRTDLIPVAQVVTNPSFSQSRGDIGVLIVASLRTNRITPATLPPAGLLDQLAAQNGLAKAIFTAVGYGVQNRVTGGGQPFFQNINPVPRMFAYSGFNALTPQYLRLSQNPSIGNGGTCYGDSGGPNFFDYNGTLLLAAITITGDTPCRSTNVDFRLDTDPARSFLAAYVTLP